MNFLDDNPRKVAEVLGLVYVPELGFYTEEGEVVARWDGGNTYHLTFRDETGSVTFWADNKIIDSIWLGGKEMVSIDQWEESWTRLERKVNEQGRSKYAAGAATF